MGRGGRCRVLPLRLFDQEFWIDWDLECGGEGVGLGGHADDGEEFGVLLVGQAFGAGCGGVGVDAVAAVVGDGDGDVDEFFGERVECAGGDHDLLDAWPGALEEIGLVGEGSPEVVDEVGFSRGADVVEDGLDAWVGGDFGVGPEFYGGHPKAFRCRPISGQYRRWPTHVTTRAKAKFGGLSTPRQTMKLSDAPVEMTIF